MLQNRLYRGLIVHRGQSYPGRHQPIIDEHLWQQVQHKLAANRVERGSLSKATHQSLLAGLVFDEVGERLVPSHANKRGIRYRYYVSQPLIKRGRAAANAIRCPGGRQPATLNAQRLSLDIRLPHIWPAQLAILTSS